MNCFLFLGLCDADIKKALGFFSDSVLAKKGQNLYRCGSIGLLQKGCATVLRSGDSGAEVTVRRIGIDEIFGAASLFGEWEEGKSRIIAQSDCKVIYATEADLTRLFEAFPQTAVNYISFLSDRIRFLNRRIDAFSAGSAVQKLYEYLCSQAKDRVVTLDFGLAELSRRLKMGRTSLYRSIEALEQSGLITRNKNTFTIN